MEITPNFESKELIYCSMREESNSQTGLWMILMESNWWKNEIKKKWAHGGYFQLFD